MALGEVDVTPAEGGRWVATCDCDQFAVVDSAESGWQWVLDHPCAVLDIPHQPGPADVDTMPLPELRDAAG